MSHGTEIQLPAGRLLAIEAGRGTRLEVLAGEVWITRPRDREDHVLDPGQELELERAGAMLVQAFTPAAVRITRRTPWWSALFDRERRPRGVGSLRALAYIRAGARRVLMVAKRKLPPPTIEKAPP